MNIDEIAKEYAQYRAEKRGFEPGGYIKQILFLLDQLAEKDAYLKLAAEAFSAQLLAVYESDKGLRAKVAELENAQRWIPVGERLPDVCTDGVTSNWVLITGPNMAVTKGYCDLEYSEWVSDSENDAPVTYWMPMPSGPMAQLEADRTERIENEAVKRFGHKDENGVW